MTTRRRLTSGTARLMRLATYASVGDRLVLIAVKLVAWMLTDSVSLLSTLIDSLLDAAASLVTSLRCASPDAGRPEHRFGHGKAEPLAALGQAAFITGSAVFLVFEAAHRLFDPRHVRHVGSGIGFSIVAIA